MTDNNVRLIDMAFLCLCALTQCNIAYAKLIPSLGSTHDPTAVLRKDAEKIGYDVRLKEKPSA